MPLYETLREYAKETHQHIHVICNKDHAPLELSLDNFFKVAHRPNVGLEFGAYAHFMMNFWRSTEDVLFMHDDIMLTKDVLKEISNYNTAYQAYIFKNLDHYKKNIAHGRMIFCRSQFLNEVSRRGGIWFDEGNVGYTAPDNSGLHKPPSGCQDHNAGIKHFDAMAGAIGDDEEMLTQLPMYIEEIEFGFRGKF